MATQPGFDLHAVLKYPDRSAIAQGATIETHSGDIYATQDIDGNLHITRFAKAGSFIADITQPRIARYEPTGTMMVRHGGHGDLALDVERVNGDICPSFVDHNGDLWRIPYQEGQNVVLKGSALDNGRMPIRGHDGTVLVRRVVKNDPDGRVFHFYGPKNRSVDMHGQGTATALREATDRLFRIHHYRWIQGYAYHQGILYTGRGSPEVKGGFLYPEANVKPYIERRRAIENPRGELLEPWKIEDLGRDEAGFPIDGKTELEALFVAMWSGQPYLFVGIATGHHFDSSYSLRLYRKAL